MSRPVWRRRLSLLCCALVLAGCAVRPPVGIDQPANTGGGATTRTDTVRPAEVVDLTTNDGAKLVTGWRPAASKARAGLVLVPMLGGSHEDYARFSQALAGYNIASLAVSLRGAGGSVAPKGKARTAFTAADWLAARQDIAAAQAELERRVGDAPIALVGASIGANLAVAQAAAKPEGIAGLVLLSPGLDYHGVKLLEPWAKVRDLPALVVTAADDPQSVPGATLQAKHNPDRISLLQYDGQAHGTDLFEANTALTGKILDWVGQLK